MRHDDIPFSWSSQSIPGLGTAPAVRDDGDAVIQVRYKNWVVGELNVSAATRALGQQLMSTPPPGFDAFARWFHGQVRGR